jgi:hypothetical protein
MLATEEQLITNHQTGDCGGEGECSICAFQDMNRLMVAVGRYIYCPYFINLIPRDNFAISSFLRKLGPQEANGCWIIKKSSYPLDKFQEKVSQFVNVDVEYYEYCGMAPTYDMAGRIMGCLPDPLTTIFKLEDTEREMLW